MTKLQFSKKTHINLVPTNIVTGFLGSGKSTLIQSLIKNKSNDEHWVILINEFGEVGLDEQIIESSVLGDDKTESSAGNIQISQIAGGCLCCANGVPFQVALVQLLKQQKKSPDRLIIEPTGLGHPKQIINQLNALSYIDLQTVFSVVDPRKVQDTRYAGHELFKTQISVANVIVCNKKDRFNNKDYCLFETWLDQNAISADQTVQTEQGLIDQTLLSYYRPKIKMNPPKLNLLLNSANLRESQDSIEFMDYQSEQSKSPIQLFEQNVEDFYAIGFIFDQSFTFDEDKLINEIMDLDVIRIKGMVNIHNKVLLINAVDDVFTQSYTQNKIGESRFQFISDQPLSASIIQTIILNTKYDDVVD